MGTIPISPWKSCKSIWSSPRRDDFAPSRIWHFDGKLEDVLLAGLHLANEFGRVGAGKVGREGGSAEERGRGNRDAIPPRRNRGVAGALQLERAIGTEVTANRLAAAAAIRVGAEHDEAAGQRLALERGL